MIGPKTPDWSVPIALGCSAAIAKPLQHFRSEGKTVVGRSKSEIWPEEMWIIQRLKSQVRKGSRGLLIGSGGNLPWLTLQCLLSASAHFEKWMSGTAVCTRRRNALISTVVLSSSPVVSSAEKTLKWWTAKNFVKKDCSSAAVRIFFFSPPSSVVTRHRCGYR